MIFTAVIVMAYVAYKLFKCKKMKVFYLIAAVAIVASIGLILTIISWIIQNRTGMNIGRILYMLSIMIFCLSVIISKSVRDISVIGKVQEDE